MAEITVLCAGQNNVDALRLTIESFRLHNADIPYQIFYWDNNSTDGAQEWALDNVDRVFIKDGPIGHHHGVALDRMAAEVRTPYVLTLDNDMRIRGPFLARLLDELREANAFAAAPAARMTMGTVDHYGILLHGQKRIDPCCALFEAPRLATMVQSVSFTPHECTNLGKFYDTGSMIRHAAEGAGLRVLDVEWLWEKIDHYGSLTLGAHAPEDSPAHRLFDRRMAQIRQDLEDLERDLIPRELVIARYQEPLDWLGRVPSNVRVTAYDKSGDAGASALPNVGREAHTYAHHVATRYDDLAAVTYFVQGDPFPHVPDLAGQLRRTTTGFLPLSPWRLITHADGDESHRGLPNAEIFTELTGLPFPETVRFSPGACFAAHRNVLQRFPRSWWQRLTQLLAEDTRRQLPWVMERMWGLILTATQPHLYHNAVGWFTDHKLYRSQVLAAAEGAHFVEIGSWVGRSALFMATEIANSHKRIRFDAVDHFQGSASEGEHFMRVEAEQNGGTMRSVFERNLGPMLRHVNVVEGSSIAAAMGYADRSLDFVFLDAGHLEDEVIEDIRAWLPKVKSGGILAGHDFYGNHPGVARAVRACFDTDFEEVPPISWLHRRR